MTATKIFISVSSVVIVIAAVLVELWPVAWVAFGLFVWCLVRSWEDAS